MKTRKKAKDTIFRIVASLIVGFINGFFGGGGGLVCVPTLEKVYKLETKKAHATAIAVMLPLSIISSIIYIFNNKFNISISTTVTCGVLVGGFIGAIFLKKFNSCVIKWIFIVILFSAGVRMLA